MQCLRGDCCCRRLFGCCLLPPWSPAKKTRSGCCWSTPGSGLWGEGLTAAQRQLPSPRLQDPHHKCCFHQQDTWLLSELRAYLCLWPLRAHLSMSKGEAFTYLILSAHDIMFLSNQDLGDTAVLSLAIIILQRPDFGPESGVLVRHNGRPMLHQGLSYHITTCCKTEAQEQRKHIIKQ